MTLALAIAALVVSAVTVIAVARQVTEAKKSNTLPTAIDLFSGPIGRVRTSRQRRE